MSKRIRTFIAVEVSRAIRVRLVSLQEELAQAAPDAKWVNAQDLHITLKFLGDVDDPDTYSVCKTVQQIAAEAPAFDIVVAGAGGFPNGHRPRVIWAGVRDGARELIAIHQALDRELASQGYAREGRPFTPHLTLARIRRTSSNPRLAAVLRDQAAWEGGRMSVTELQVMASFLSPDGPQYSVLGRAPLGTQDSL
jgi:2'-5' RNA ligase